MTERNTEPVEADPVSPPSAPAEPASVPAGEARLTEADTARVAWVKANYTPAPHPADEPVDAPRATPSEPLREALRAMEYAEAYLKGEHGIRWPPDDESHDAAQWTDAKALIKSALTAAPPADDLRAERDELRAYANAKDAELRRAYMLAEAAEKDDLRPQVQALRDRYQAMSMVMHRGVDVAFALDAILAPKENTRA